MEQEAACAQQLLNVGRHTFADPGNLKQLLDVTGECGNLLGIALQCFGSTTIRTDAEGIIAVDFHQVGGVVEDSGDGLVVHYLCPGRIVSCSMRCWRSWNCGAQKKPS